MSKKKIIKDYHNMPKEIIDDLKEKYPYGYDRHLISFITPKGNIEIALPYETEDISYLIKMPKKVEVITDEDIEALDEDLPKGVGTEDMANESDDYDDTTTDDLHDVPDDPVDLDGED